jgi:hypothetical protein
MTTSHVLAAILGSVCLAAPVAAQVTRVSVSTAGAQADGASFTPAVSASGRFVVFASQATNLVAGDTNGTQDIFLRDRDTDADGIFDEAGAVATTRVSVGAGGVQADNLSRDPIITPDGRFVFFGSEAGNLVPGGPVGFALYRFDRQAGTVIRVDQMEPTSQVSASADGDVVVYVSATNNQFTTIRAITSGQTSTIPIPPAPDPQLGGFFNASISADGLRIVFLRRESVNTNPQTFFQRAWAYDRTTAAMTLLGEGVHDARIVDSGKAAIVVYPDRLVRHVIDSGAETPPLPTMVPAAALTAFVRSRGGRYAITNATRLYDFDLGIATDLPFGAEPGEFSSDDRWLAFLSASSTLLPGDTNNVADVFVADLPAFFDADHDTMDDRWETMFGVTSATADPDGDGVNNAAEENAGTHPNGVFKRYFAEGATGLFFATTMWLANPDPTNAAHVVLNFDSGLGNRRTYPLTLAPGGSAAVNVGAVSGFEASDVSTTIESDRLIVADRSMEWGLEKVPNGHGYGSSAESSIPAPSTQWFLAEGSTVLGFDLFYMLQNPGSTIAHVTVRYLPSSGNVITRTYDMAPRTRTTIYLNSIAGLEETDVSGDISSDLPIIVERSMYRSTPTQQFKVGTASSGVTAPATRWFLAEGSTGAWFDLYVLFANPGNTDAHITAEYARENGVVVTRTYLVGAHSRFSVFVDSIPGLEETAVATTVTSDVPIVVERAMYWPGSFFQYYEGHTAVGTTGTSERWAIARGDSEGGAQTFVLLANTDTRPGQAELRIMTPTGFAPALQRVVNLPANSRTTVELTGMPAHYGVLVTSVGASPVELVVESAVYRNYRGVLWASGSDEIATPLP